MTPLLFPFTCLSEKQINLIAGCFRDAVLFTLDPDGSDAAPDPRWSGQLTVIGLDAGEASQVKASVEAFRQWAALHQSGKGSLHAQLRNTPYFTEDASVRSLKSDILKGSGIGLRKPETRSRTEDPWYEALLFLKLAQEADRENETIEQSLSSIRQKENRLFSSLKGELAGDTDTPATGLDTVAEKDPGAVKTGRRLRSWSMLMNQKKHRLKEAGPLVLTTMSPAVFEYLESIAQKSTKVLDIDGFKVHEGRCATCSRLKDAVQALLEKGSESGQPGADLFLGTADTCRLTARIKVADLSGDDIDRLFHPDGQDTLSQTGGQLDCSGVRICLLSESDKNT